MAWKKSAEQGAGVSPAFWGQLSRCASAPLTEFSSDKFGVLALVGCSPQFSMGLSGQYPWASQLPFCEPLSIGIFEAEKHMNRTSIKELVFVGWEDRLGREVANCWKKIVLLWLSVAGGIISPQVRLAVV